jgi:hypothetical protein
LPASADGVVRAIRELLTQFDQPLQHATRQSKQSSIKPKT